MTPLLIIAAGLAAIAVGTVLLRSYGPRARVARLLAVTPPASIEEALALATSGQRRYVRVDGRIDADESLSDEHDRPLVYRRRRIEAHLGGTWRSLEDGRDLVPFRLVAGAAELTVDGAALDAGLVTMVRESVGTSDEVADQLPRRLPPGTPVRLRIEQLSSVEHASVLGVPMAGPDGSARIGPGTGRPLIVCTLERDEAMRILAEGRRARPIAAAVALGGGLAALAAGLGWALLAGSLA